MCFGESNIIRAEGVFRQGCYEGRPRMRDNRVRRCWK